MDLPFRKGRHDGALVTDIGAEEAKTALRVGDALPNIRDPPLFQSRVVRIVKVVDGNDVVTGSEKFLATAWPISPAAPVRRIWDMITFAIPRAQRTQGISSPAREPLWK